MTSNTTKLELKILYSLNNTQLNSLRSQFSIERLENYKNGEIVDYLIFHKNNINQLIKQQSSIKDRIPYNKLNLVNNFLIDITGDVNSFEEKIQVQQIQKQEAPMSNFNMYKTNSALNFNIDPQINLKTQETKSQMPIKNKIDNSIDPYKVFGFEKNKPINIEELKRKYKIYALQTHPDKNNGKTRNFVIIQECFKKIFNDYKLQQNDKQFNELRNGSLNFIEKQSKENKINKHFDKQNFNISKFNKVYAENKLSDTNDDGYGEWIKENSFDSEDIRRDNSLTSGNFNQKFNSEVKMTNEMIRFEKPQEMFMNAENNCYELGKQKTESYSGKTKHMSYTDYREAHTTNKLIDTNMKYKTYNNIDDIHKERENIKNLTEEEILQIEIEKQKKKDEEEKRMKYISHQDQLYSQHYERMNHIMLK